MSAADVSWVASTLVDRVRSQRMYLVCVGEPVMIRPSRPVADFRPFTQWGSDRERHPDSLYEIFKVLGSTGNVYTITVALTPTCDYPDG